MGAYADLQHGRVWYEVQGSGPPLVLIHGGAVDSRFFDKNIGPLGEHLRVIAVDLWGHGRSSCSTTRWRPWRPCVARPPRPEHRRSGHAGDDRRQGPHVGPLVLGEPVPVVKDAPLIDVPRWDRHCSGPVPCLVGDRA